MFSGGVLPETVSGYKGLRQVAMRPPYVNFVPYPVSHFRGRGRLIGKGNGRIFYINNL